MQHTAKDKSPDSNVNQTSELAPNSNEESKTNEISNENKAS